METIFMNTENNKTSESHRFKLDLTDKLNLKDPKKSKTGTILRMSLKMF